MTSECVALWPEKACGRHGNCIPFGNDTGISVCDCDDGWSQTKELNFFTDHDPISFSRSTCVKNDMIMLSLRVIQCTIAGSYLLLFFVKYGLPWSEKKKKWRHHIIIFLTFLMLFVDTIYRVSLAISSDIFHVLHKISKTSIIKKKLRNICYIQFQYIFKYLTVVHDSLSIQKVLLFHLIHCLPYYWQRLSQVLHLRSHCFMIDISVGYRAISTLTQRVN
mmetsp:Transcript_17548/g.22352  ORF Transcript_17548/g.22352 Transcript_17548/m.22352 type:complete len:220 (-) Transcript_17548:1791-2450(-)